MTNDFEKGVEVRNKMFGAERTKQSLAGTDELNQKFQSLITSYCFGSLWGEKGVIWRDRSLMTMCIVAAQHRFTEFELHTKLALKNGVERDVIIEVVRHLTVYCGVPTGAEAFRTVQRVFQEADTPADKK